MNETNFYPLRPSLDSFLASLATFYPAHHYLIHAWRTNSWPLISCALFRLASSARLLGVTKVVFLLLLSIFIALSRIWRMLQNDISEWKGVVRPCSVSLMIIIYTRVLEHREAQCSIQVNLRHLNKILLLFCQKFVLKHMFKHL